jgi:tRNA threonylcarbamoyladenosine biosynthesis protein TsaB
VNIVAIETATETVGVAVRTGSGAEAALTLSGRRRHVETLAPALEHLLGQVDLKVTDLDLVAVDIGPGLFTGLRVGVAAAKGLGQALGIGVIGLTSLEILTHAAAQLGHRGHVLAAVDARRGEVFASVRALPDVRELRDVRDERELRDVRELQSGDAAAEDGAEDVIESGLFTPDELVTALSKLGGVRIVGVGDGAQRYAAVLDRVAGVTCVTAALAAPPPSTLLALASARHENGTVPLDPALVVPLYMRAADATSNFAQARPV